MPTVSTAIMAHPKRARHVEWLRAHLDADPPVVWDRYNDRWETGRRSLLAYDPDCSHHLVVQDDAVPCRDLVAGLSVALANVPWDAPVSLYMGKPRPKRQTVDRLVHGARNAGRAWALHQGPLWGVGIVLPTSIIDQLVAWCDTQTSANYDSRVAEWFRRVHPIPCWYTMPSLVDHRGAEPSLVPGRTSTSRYAAWFIGQDASALTVDWTAVPKLEAQ